MKEWYLFDEFVVQKKEPESVFLPVVDTARMEPEEKKEESLCVDMRQEWIRRKKDERVNQERFDNHEPMEDDDDDIRDLDDYLIPNDAPYYADKEEERFKERRSKLRGIPYKKPPMFKSEKFEVRTKENVSHVYQEIFYKKYEGWFQYGISTTMDTDTAYRLEVLNENEESGDMHIIRNLMCVVHARIQMLFATQHT
ncbi:hypothetical protein Tco_0011059 [Tanacetum coccineum]